MSSIFELNERVRRLRETFSYFKNAALLTGAEVREAAQGGSDQEVHAEWARLLGELRQCLQVAEAALPREDDAAQTSRVRAPAMVDFNGTLDPAATRH